MAELIAYVALYGVVMSLLASLVFVIVVAARKVNAQSILNRGTAIMYTEIVSEVVSLNPDTVYDHGVSDDGDSISVEFQKQFYYTDSGEKKLVADNAAYNNKIVRIKYTYVRGSDNIDVLFTYGNTNTVTSSINLEYNMCIYSHDDNNPDTDDINTVFSVNRQNSTNTYVTFHGDLKYDNKRMEFNFIVPVFTIS